MERFNKTDLVYFKNQVEISDIVIFEDGDKFYIGKVDQIESKHYSNGDMGYRILTNQNNQLVPTEKLVNDNAYSDWAYWVKLDDIILKFK